MFVIGIPVLEQHELTQKCVQSLQDTIGDNTQLHLVILDNHSTEPYKAEEFNTVFPLTIIRYEENKGFYWPLLDLFNRFGETAEFIGLMHNDVVFYERYWERRINFSFRTDPQLMLLGLCGGWYADHLGGRGKTTMCNFRSDIMKQHGTQIIEVKPAVLLDSLFMLFRTSFIPTLGIDDEITLCHFYDKIWSMKTIETGNHVAVIGIEIDHSGGNTSCSTSYQEDAKTWCKKHDLELENGSGDLAIYHEGERRFLTEFRDQKGIIPVRVDNQYKLWKI